VTVADVGGSVAWVTIIVAVRAGEHIGETATTSSGDGLGVKDSSVRCHLPAGWCETAACDVVVGGGGAGLGAERVDRVERRLQDRAVAKAGRRAEDQPPGGPHDPQRDAEE
jgi:hypothetical protein